VRPVVFLSVALALGACERRDPVAEEANTTAAPTDVDVLPADESAATPTEQLQNGAAEEQNTDAAAAGKIPASFHGRWGLSPEDCTSTRGDDKGLLVITGGELRFYESVATPAGSLEATANSVSGRFAFTGEGMSWTRHQVLQLNDRKLVRTESTPMASYTYARCTS